MNNSKKVYSYIRLILVLAGIVIMIYPLLWMISSSLKPEMMIFKEKGLLVRELTFEHYVRGLKGVAGTTFFHYMFNTAQVVLPVIIGTLISSSMTGFAVARLDFPFKKLITPIVLVTMMLPMHATLIPRYTMFRSLGWTDSYLPLFIPSFFAVHGFFNYLFIQFMRGIPKELDQAATVDGCGPFRIYIRIIAPLSIPAFITTAIFSLIWTYDDFFSQLIYINTPTKFTIALALRQYIEALEMSAFGVLFAVSTMSLIPIFIFFITCQKYLIEGIATTGMKG